MGFNKRMITKELIMSTEDSKIENLFNADALIFDNWSYTFFEIYNNGMSKNEIINKITNAD